MPRKKNSSNSSEPRYSPAPSKANAAKAADTTPKNGEPKLPPATSAAVALIAALRHSDADAARDAATSLGALGDANAVEPLIQVLSNRDGYYHAVVRAAAAVSLGQLGDGRAVEPLINAIQDSLAEPSAEAIRALGAIGDSRAVNPLIDVIRNPNGFFSPTARRAAVGALSRLQFDERAAAELLTVSTNPWEDPVIRQAAIDIIGSSAKKPAKD